MTDGNLHPGWASNLPPFVATGLILALKREGVIISSWNYILSGLLCAVGLATLCRHLLSLSYTIERSNLTIQKNLVLHDGAATPPDATRFAICAITEGFCMRMERAW